MNNKKNRQYQPQNPGKTVRRLFSYFRFNKKLLFAGLFIMVAASIVQVIANGMISPVVDAVAVYEDYSAFVRNLTLMALLMVLVLTGHYYGARFMAILAHKTVYQIRDEMSRKVLDLPISYYDRVPQGETMSSFTNDVDILIQSLEQSVTQLVLSAIMFFGTFIMMLTISWTMALMVLVFLAGILLVMRFIASTSGKYYRRRQQTTAEMNGFVEEMIGAQKVVKVFNYEDRAIEIFDEKADRLRYESTKASTFGVMTMPVVGNFSTIMYIAVAIIGSLQIIAGNLTIGNLTAFLQHSRNIARPIMQVSVLLNAIFASIAGAERIFNILDLKEEEMDGDVRLEKACTGRKNLCWLVPDGRGGVDRVPVSGYVRFDRVDFGYDPDKPVLKDISLYAKPGQKIALVGSTGAGKTTISNLINRFYDISEGSITIDGIDIRRINKLDLRSILSIVLQDVKLFSGSLKNNIRLGLLEADDDDVVAAAKVANAHSFIAKLEAGYETEIDARGSGLSQGEQQLISIARAAIADPVILIMDEATSSVDTRTEHMISEAMDKLMKNRTTFVIAHRLSTVRGADAIIVLEDGRIIERGNHDELMKLKGRYYDLNVGVSDLD